MGLARTGAMMGGSVQLASKSLSLTGNNETLSQNIFQLTESVLIHALWLEVTTVIVGTMTSVGFRLESSGGTANMDGISGTLSNLVAGAIIPYPQMASDGLSTANPSGAPAVRTASNSGDQFRNFGSRIIVQHPSTATYIALRYTTTSTPITGVVMARIFYEKLTTNGALVAV